MTCSGRFIYAMDVGSQFVKTGRYRNVLAIGAETLQPIGGLHGSLKLYSCLAMVLGAVVLQQQ